MLESLFGHAEKHFAASIYIAASRFALRRLCIDVTICGVGM